MNEFEQLKQELADSAAISDIEVMLVRVGEFDERWYDTRTPHPDDEAGLLKALKYLGYRNMIEKHPDNKYWARIIQS